MKPALSKRQREVAEFVARGLPNKIIAAKTGLALKTVQHYVEAAAARIPGKSSPRNKLTLWFFNIAD